jgi:hypothetical protein
MRYITTHVDVQSLWQRGEHGRLRTLLSPGIENDQLQANLRSERPWSILEYLFSSRRWTSSDTPAVPSSSCLHSREKVGGGTAALPK